MKEVIQAASYSPKQDAFHIDDLSEELHETKKQMMENRITASNYYIFAIGTRQHCLDEIDAMKKIVRADRYAEMEEREERENRE